MADRNDRYRRQQNYRDQDSSGSRQAEQFDDYGYSDDYYDGGQPSRGRGSQMGESGGNRPAGAFYYEETTITPRRSRSYGGSQDRGSYSDTFGSPRNDRYARASGSYGASRYESRDERGFEPFTSEDQNGRDFVRGGGSPYGAGSYNRGYYGQASSGSYGTRNDYGSESGERGFFEKAGDEIASWFGDDDAARRRQQDHRGSGPSNYTRSDERILEDACDKLTDDWAVDARNVQVTVKDGEITLDGTVDNRSAKRRAEDCVDSISGVKHVQNNLRVQDSTTANYGGTSTSDS
ncbi:MAG: BON domain-containing protein [Tsuneonella sp.]